MWPAAPAPPRTSREWSIFRLKIPKGGPFYLKNIFISDFHEIWNLIPLRPKKSTHEIYAKSEMKIFWHRRVPPLDFSGNSNVSQKNWKTQSRTKWPPVTFLYKYRKFSKHFDMVSWNFKKITQFGHVKSKTLHCG